MNVGFGIRPSAAETFPGFSQGNIGKAAGLLRCGPAAFWLYLFRFEQGALGFLAFHGESIKHDGQGKAQHIP